MKRWLFLAILAMPLGGCVLPPAISIASLALDIGSFAATGKSATDHVISGVAGEDCRMLGILEGEICREEQEFESAVASLEPLRPLPEAPADTATPLPDQQFAEARRAPVPLLQPEPPLTPMPLQLASADASDVAPDPLAELQFLSAGALRESPETTPAPAIASAPLSDRDPAARQVAALTAVPANAEAGAAFDSASTLSLGMVYGDNGHALGISYAFQNPLADMDGSRDSLGAIEIVDR